MSKQLTTCPRASPVGVAAWGAGPYFQSLIACTVSQHGMGRVGFSTRCHIHVKHQPSPWVPWALPPSKCGTFPPTRTPPYAAHPGLKGFRV